MAWPAVAAYARGDGPQDAERGELREQRWHIPTTDGSGRSMRATVFRPPGGAPAPLVVVNHGSRVSGNATMPVPRFSAAAGWFVRRGCVVVVPLRRGYGETGGRWNESYGHCENADFHRAGLEAARDIEAAVAYMRAQPFVRTPGTIVVGQSAGGWGSLAVASRNPADIPAIVNFAGGRGGRRGDVANVNCSPDKLVAGAAAYGRTARVPTLWIYTVNDTYFDPGLSRRMADAYRAAGGNVDYRLLPAFGRDGHSLFGAADGVPVWSTHVGPFLDRFR